MEITKEIAKKVLETVDAGLVKGMGTRIPGQMCVEAAVCYAMGLDHDDDPICVSRPLRSLKIRLNDSNWSSSDARAKGLRRLAVAQLGSRDVLDDREFGCRLVDLAIRKQVPIALRAAASINKNSKHKAALLLAADRCEKEGTRESVLNANKTAYTAAYTAYTAAAAAAYTAYTAAAAAYTAYYAAYYAAYTAAAYTAYTAAAAAYTAYYAAYSAYYAAACDKVLSEFAEDVVQILIDMKVPGVQWLYLTEI